MANETPITLIGNAARVELRFTPQGRAVASFAVASTPRRYNKDSGQWEDGETLWMNCNVWGQQAENLAETIGDAKSLRVIVSGDLKQRSYQTKEGEQRTVYEVEVDEVAPSLKFASAQVNRTPREGGGGGFGGGQQQGGFQQPNPQQQGQGGFNAPAPQQAQQDPWAQQAAFPASQDQPHF